ncbi:dTDP-4-dehydrorhamnose reductase [bioreactor metagenome]|uniref:dTDP-4-dehydrorhamnose reductase n=1 Tax=bioreactor metagenome TaxID=1076179 RepID=A0A644WZ80_9ZZZZ
MELRTTAAAEQNLERKACYMRNGLIVGCNGQLGTELVTQLTSGQSELGAIPQIYSNIVLTCLDIPQIDITNLEKTIALVEQSRPDVIFNCAAYTNVDACETHEDDAYRVNALGARNLAIAAERVGAKIMHMSTDYVFSGDGTSPYREYDCPCPVSVYGKTKLAGEQFVQSFSNRYFVVRTSWLYGYHGKNFVKAILNRARAEGKVTVVNDQRGNPTNAADLAYHMLKIAATEEFGVYHCTGNGECSWFEFAEEILRLADFGATALPCTSAEYPSPTKRPAYSSLEHMMLRTTVGDEMRPWREALASFISHFRNSADWI